jgi:hypothetical protein
LAHFHCRAFVDGSGSGFSRPRLRSRDPPPFISIDLSAFPNPNDIEFDNLYLDNVIEGRAVGTKVFTVIAAIVEQEEVGIDFHVSLWIVP